MLERLLGRNPKVAALQPHARFEKIMPYTAIKTGSLRIAAPLRLISNGNQRHEKDRNCSHGMPVSARITEGLGRREVRLLPIRSTVAND